MFRGINNATLDAKGRMALPARFREPVTVISGSRVVVTIDMREKCLLLYPLPEWEVVQRKLESLDNVGTRARLLQRLLIGHATDLELDSNGRILLPALLREYAQLEKGLVLLGQGNKVEIWSDALWQTRMQDWLGEDTEGVLDSGDDFTGLSV